MLRWGALHLKVLMKTLKSHWRHQIFLIKKQFNRIFALLLGGMELTKIKLEPILTLCTSRKLTTKKIITSVRSF